MCVAILEPIMFWQGSKSDNDLLLFFPSTSCNFYIANTIFYQVLLASFIVVNSRVHISFIMIKSVNCLITCSYLLTIVCDSCMWTSWSFGLWLRCFIWLEICQKKKKSLPENMLTTTISRTFWRNSTTKSKKIVVYTKMP